MAIAPGSYSFIGGVVLETDGGNDGGKQFVLTRSDMVTAFTDEEYNQCINAFMHEFAVAVSFGTIDGIFRQAQLVSKTNLGALTFSCTRNETVESWTVVATSPHTITHDDYELDNLDNYAPAQYGTDQVKNLPTTITAFRTGDVIPVDGPSGTAKMDKDDLLRETAENSLGSIENLEVISSINTRSKFVCVDNGENFGATFETIVKNVNDENITDAFDEESSSDAVSFVTDEGNEVARVDDEGLHVGGVNVADSLASLNGKTENITDAFDEESSSDAVSFVTDEGNEVARIDDEGLHVENLYDLEGNSFSVGKFNAKILYKSDIPNTGDFETTSWGVSGGGLSNSGLLGFANRLRLKKSYSMTHNIYHWEFQPTTNAKVVVGMESRSELNNDGMSFVFIDFATKKITFGRGRTIDNITMSDIEVSFVASDYENRKFRICVYREFNWQMRVILYNLLTSKPIASILLPITKSTASGSEGVWNSPLGHWHDAPFCYSENAAFTIYDIVVKTRVPADDAVTMCIFGDSITEGYNSDDERLTYGQRLASILPLHKIKTSGRCQGQISGVAERIASEGVPLHPKYIMVLIGVNGGNTEVNLKALIQQIIDAGSIPIINHITGSGSSYNSYNTLIDTCVNYYKTQGQEIYCVKMDISMALNYNISSGLDPNLMHDHIHPDKYGHERMFLRMRNDCPFLFND